MLTSLLLFSVTALLFAMIPGPDFALILRTALVHGRQPALFSSVGIACGLTVHTALSVAGLTAVIAHSPFLFACITYLGAAYLAYIGLRALLAGRKKAGHGKAGSGAGQERGAAGTASGTSAGGLSCRAAFCQGFLTNVLNPKAVVFFLTFLPQFVDHASSVTVPVQLLALGICMCLVTGGWFVFFSLLLARLRRFFENETFRRRLEQVTGLIFLGFSVKLVCSS